MPVNNIGLHTFTDDTLVLGTTFVDCLEASADLIRADLSATFVL